MQEKADCEKECEKWWCPGVMGKGRAGKHGCSSHSATSLLPAPQAGWTQVPLVAGCDSTNVPHTPHIATEVVTVPGLPNMSLLSFSVFLWGGISKCRVWAFLYRQTGVRKALPVTTVRNRRSLRAYSNSWPNRGCCGENTSTVSSIPSKEEKRVWKLLCWEKLFTRFYIFRQIFTIKLECIQLFCLHSLL